MGTIKIPAAEVLKKIYGETEESSARYTNLAVNFESFLLLRDVQRSLATMLTITADRSLPQVLIWILSVQLIQTELM